MRFSAIFQLPLPQRLVAPGPPTAREEDASPAPAEPVLPAPAAPPAVAPAADELDLDQRVRLIGEWQLGEVT